MCAAEKWLRELCRPTTDEIVEVVLRICRKGQLGAAKLSHGYGRFHFHLPPIPTPPPAHFVWDWRVCRLDNRTGHLKGRLGWPLSRHVETAAAPVVARHVVKGERWYEPRLKANRTESSSIYRLFMLPLHPTPRSWSLESALQTALITDNRSYASYSTPAPGSLSAKHAGS